MQIINELEPTKRNAYAGAVGYFGFDGNSDSCIALRTCVLRHGKAYVQAGAGVVADSDPAFEWQETVNKARGMLRALERARELADETLLKIRNPAPFGPPTAGGRTFRQRIHAPGDPRIPAPGTVITRDYKGRKLLVGVLDNGFEFEGSIYRSLSAVAKAATGAHWNGMLFFGLEERRAA